MSEETVEKKIQEKGLTAPRLTPEDIDATIVGKTFTRLPSGKCMICELTLKNGFTVRGEALIKILVKRFPLIMLVKKYGNLKGICCRKRTLLGRPPKIERGLSMTILLRKK